MEELYYDNQPSAERNSTMSHIHEQHQSLRKNSLLPAGSKTERHDIKSIISIWQYSQRHNTFDFFSLSTYRYKPYLWRRKKKRLFTSRCWIYRVQIYHVWPSLGNFQKTRGPALSLFISPPFFNYSDQRLYPKSITVFSCCHLKECVFYITSVKIVWCFCWQRITRVNLAQI